MNVAMTFINEKSFANYAEQRAGVLYRHAPTTADGATAELI